jgi:hypothetical protein
MKQPLSLRAKLPLSILTVVLVTFSVSTFFILYISRSVISYVKSIRMEDTAQAVGHGISMQIQRVGRDMVMVATLPSVLRGIELSPDTGPGSPVLLGEHDDTTRTSLTALLARIRLSYSYYDAFYLVNENGQHLAGISDTTNYNPASGEEAGLFREALRKNTFTVFPPVQIKTKGEVILPTMLKLVYNGRAGALVGSLQLAKIMRELLREATQTGIRPLVVARDDDIISVVDASGITTLSAGPWISEIQSRVSGSTTIAVDGEMKTAGFYHIPQTNLYALVLADESYMQSDTAAIRNATIAANIFAALLAVGCVYLFVFPVTRDILRLSLFAKGLTEGK